MMSKQYTPGPWIWQNSCSWWRLGTLRGDGYILRPAVMKDGWPTIDFPSGGPTGADAQLIARAPDIADRLDQLEQRVRALADDLKRASEVGTIYADENEACRHISIELRALLDKEES